MFPNHPVKSEFFDFAQFCEDEDSTLRSLFEETKDLIEKVPGADPIENRACLVCLAIYHDLTSFENVDAESLMHDQEDSEKMADFFTKIAARCQLYEWEKQGIVKIEDGKVSLTSYGTAWAERAEKKAKALSEDPGDSK